MNHIPQTSQFCCPSCGGHIGTAAPLDQVVENITQPSRRLIMAMLAEKPGKAVYRERIINRMYGGRSDGGPDTADHVIAALVSQLRRQIEPFGWTITNSRGGAGNLAQWRLIPVEVTP